LWHTWLDRPLGLGGRITIKTETGTKNVTYVSPKPLALVSSMCPHLRPSNPLDIKKENDIKPFIGTKLLE
jgi:aspartyl aminopeptidase